MEYSKMKFSLSFLLLSIVLLAKTTDGRKDDVGEYWGNKAIENLKFNGEGKSLPKDDELKYTKEFEPRPNIVLSWWIGKNDVVDTKTKYSSFTKDFEPRTGSFTKDFEPRPNIILGWWLGKNDVVDTKTKYSSFTKDFEPRTGSFTKDFEPRPNIVLGWWIGKNDVVDTKTKYSSFTKDFEPRPNIVLGWWIGKNDVGKDGVETKHASIAKELEQRPNPTPFEHAKTVPQRENEGKSESI